MRPEHLQSWQPDADPEYLAEFVRRHQTLLTLLEEAWQKFAAEVPPPAPAVPPAEYAAGFDVADLRHEPVSPADMAAFYERFERERGHDAA